MDSKLIFAIALVAILIIFIFMIDNNTIMKGIFGDSYGINGKINAELFSEKKEGKHSDFVPGYDAADLDNAYEARGVGPASYNNYSEYKPLSTMDGLNLKENRGAFDAELKQRNDKATRVVPISNKPVITLLGSGAPPAHEIRPAGEDPYQSLPVDGKPGSPKSMFIYSRNAMSPDCCPSQYSSDMGCVCVTPEQRDLLAQRGNNRSAPSEY